MAELFDRLLIPVGGRTGKRNAALMQTLEALLDQAEHSTGPMASRHRNARGAASS